MKKGKLFASLFPVLFLFAACRGENGMFAVEVSYEGGYSTVVHGLYSLTPSDDGESAVFRHSEVDVHGTTVEYERTYPLSELGDLYRRLVDNGVWGLPSSGLRTVTDQHTYTVSVRSAGREHTFSVYGPRHNPDERYWNVVSPLVELGVEAAPPEEFRLTMRAEGGLSELEYSLYTVLLLPRQSVLFVEEKERSGGVKARERDVPRSAVRRLYLALEENGFWELGDSRAAEGVVTDIPTYTFTLEVGDRSHSFSVYAPTFDPDPRYGAVTRAVYDLAAGPE
jgi:hypothetical protein